MVNETLSRPANFSTEVANVGDSFNMGFNMTLHKNFEFSFFPQIVHLNVFSPSAMIYIMESILASSSPLLIPSVTATFS